MFKLGFTPHFFIQLLTCVSIYHRLVELNKN
nr:hypothetical protein YSBCXYJI_YSBCXYJI_CDS_0036 [Caudoviricetes sp.]